MKLKEMLPVYVKHVLNRHVAGLTITSELGEGIEFSCDGRVVD
jgi:hypothetical protein